jgi:small subunit ribosomal protein S18
MPRPARPGQKRRPPMLPRDVAHVDYKDVTLLQKFVTDRGKIRARRVTGLTPQQQRSVVKAIKNAREMALLPYGPSR